ADQVEHRRLDRRRWARPKVIGHGRADAGQDLPLNRNADEDVIVAECSRYVREDGRAQVWPAEEENPLHRHEHILEHDPGIHFVERGAQWMILAGGVAERWAANRL